MTRTTSITGRNDFVFNVNLLGFLYDMKHNGFDMSVNIGEYLEQIKKQHGIDITKYSVLEGLSIIKELHEKS